MKEYIKRQKCYCSGPPYERCELCKPNKKQKKQMKKSIRKKIKQIIKKIWATYEPF